MSHSHTYTFVIQGMTCAACSARIEKVLSKTKGVLEAQVDLMSERGRVTVTPDLSAQNIQDIIQRTGFTALPFEEKQPIAPDADRNSGWWVALILTLPLFIIEMGGHMVPQWHTLLTSLLPTQHLWYLQFILTSAVILGPGRFFFYKGIPSLFRGHPDMNALVVLGVSAAYLFSACVTFFPMWIPTAAQHVYYEAAAMIITLLLLGKQLEHQAKGKTSLAIQQLIALQPAFATKCTNSGTEEIAIADVQINDKILIKPGERIPADGVIVAGESYIDESMLTGEPMATLKSIKQAVHAGTLNQAGTLTIEVTQTGNHSLLGQIISLVEQAQALRLPIQTLVNHITLWFVPIVLLLATLTFFIWWIFGPAPAITHALVNAVAVLIVACPCAMGLATPTSIMVGTGRGAKAGVLFRQGDALQKLREVQAIVLDKTGTLTEGKPSITDTCVQAGYEWRQVLQWCASIELHSEHPIAHAIVAEAKTQQIELLTTDNFQSIAGQGIRATVEQAIIYIGTSTYLAQQGIAIEWNQSWVQTHMSQGKTPIYIARNNHLIAILCIADRLRPSTRQAIQQMQAKSIPVIMLTGDRAIAANAIAHELGIKEVIAEVLPAEKQAAILRIQDTYGITAYIGDGINDAPALASADIGIAMGNASDIAIEAADVVLVANNLQRVLSAIQLSQATIRNIRQNLFWAFAYNMLLIPLAAGVLYPLFDIRLSPVLAASAMALSSIFVVSNALRLRYIKL